MKDYTLSEVASRCIENQTLYNGTVLYDCKNCEFEQICSPTKWGSKVGEIIEPRDMIELPCKEHFTYTHDNGHITENWRVFYRAEFALIGTAVFPTELEADAFLAKKKTEKEKDDKELAELKEAEVKFYDAFNRLSYKKRTEGEFGDADVDELLAAYDRMCEIEKKRGMRK